MGTDLPISVIIATKNEENNLPNCLAALQGFGQIIVHDSYSQDNTAKIAKSYGAFYIPFAWNGTYPKKRQYCLDLHSLEIKYDWVFFVDADEIVTPELISELNYIFQHKKSQSTCGYFVKGQYIWNNKKLHFGMQNNKIALFNRHLMEFPVVDDLNIPGMGEIEGHYQPIKKPQAKNYKIKQLNEPLLHNAYTNPKAWQERHEHYAQWEDEMDRQKSWPNEDNHTRQILKQIFKACPPRIKASIAFVHCYIIKLGFLDGKPGFAFARARAKYYQR